MNIHKSVCQDAQGSVNDLYSIESLDLVNGGQCFLKPSNLSHNIFKTIQALIVNYDLLFMLG